MDFLKNISHGLRLDRAVAADIASARGYLDFDVGYPGSVLSPVDLFLHHHRQLVDGVEGRFVFVDEVLKRLAQTDKRDSALVLDGIAHEKMRVFEWMKVRMLLVW